MALKRVTLPITTTGSAGSATGSAVTPVPNGVARLIAVDIDFGAVPATTDTTIAADRGTVLTVTNSNTDKTYYPRVPVQVAAGTDLAGRGEEPPIVEGTVTVSLAQADALATAATIGLVFDV
jgi:hypothetical protein